MAALSAPQKKKRRAWAVAAVAIVAAGSWMALQRGGPPKLPLFVPPVYGGANLQSEESNEAQGSAQRIRIYSVKAPTETVLGFYRKELLSRGLKMAAQGGGPYGGFLQAADDSGRRTVFVEVDAPEDKPAEPAKITLRVLDKH